MNELISVHQSETTIVITYNIHIDLRKDFFFFFFLRKRIADEQFKKNDIFSAVVAMILCEHVIIDLAESECSCENYEQEVNKIDCLKDQ